MHVCIYVHSKYTRYIYYVIKTFYIQISKQNEVNVWLKQE